MTRTENETLEGTKMFVQHLERLVEEESELADIHDAFEFYCANKYSLGSTAEDVRMVEIVRTGGKNQLGIDFYSREGARYLIGQCKIPARDWLEKNPVRIKRWKQNVIDDPRTAIRFLSGNSEQPANENVRRLYGLVQNDRKDDEFKLTLLVAVYGVLEDKAKEAFEELKEQYPSNQIRFVVHEMDQLVDEFLVGKDKRQSNIQLKWSVDNSKALNTHNCNYFLAQVDDVFRAFQDYGWRLFDLNLRYEVRNSPVNADIVRSLESPSSRSRFHHLNNGLIIIVKNSRFIEKGAKIVLTEPQIVNGLQTVKSIYDAVTAAHVPLEDLSDCNVQVKIIESQTAELVSQIVMCTNNQNPMNARNLKAKTREQNTLKQKFKLLDSKWFFQTKQGEWDSLNQESGRFFKQLIGYPVTHFRPSPTRKTGRVIDNQDAAKAWLSFCGFADKAGDRTTHFFTVRSIYDLCFLMRPSAAHWERFKGTVDFDEGREGTMERTQGSVSQYLLAYSIWLLVKEFVLAPKQYHEAALEEGVKSGKIKKKDGSFTTSASSQDEFLSSSLLYQTWRILANMKEGLVEAITFILAKRYGALEEEVCEKLLSCFDIDHFLSEGNVREVARASRDAKDLKSNDVFSRILKFMHYSAEQYWVEHQKSILAQARPRTFLLKRSSIAQFKSTILELQERVTLEKVWKREGTTFIDSLPDPKRKQLF